MRLLTIAIGWMFAMTAGAVELTDTIGAQEEMEAPIEQLADTVVAEPEQPKKKLGLIRRIIRGFDRLDERYIEPQHYVFAAMLQTTYNYERYSLSGGDQSITMKPDRNLRVGPYAGWKWVFLGYCFELGNLNFGGGRREFDFSMYSSQIGIDLFYRRTGQDYKLKQVNFGNADMSELEDQPFNGIEVGITGANIYYIFNHGRFSYPAAFSQSTIQKISCGSWLAGVGYTRHSLDFDSDQLQDLIDSKFGKNAILVDSGLRVDEVRYYDLSISGGYAYNWVFAKNWLLGSSVQLALGYKRTYGDMEGNTRGGFTFKNMNIDGVGRFGLVYNNMRWYAGASAIVHTYNYSMSRFRTNNTFGSLNVYVGCNFGLKKKYRKKS